MTSDVTRRDRNSHITVDTGAIQTAGGLSDLFTVVEENSAIVTDYGLPYDYNSAVHYAANVCIKCNKTETLMFSVRTVCTSSHFF